VSFEALLGEAIENCGNSRADRLRGLQERWRERRFTLLVVGEFKRGKSTLINALVGREVLPVGVVPVTAIATRVERGDRAAARVQFRDGRESDTAPSEISEYVTEAGNPENRKNVRTVSVQLPSAFLDDGVTLVDVPGLGSAHLQNTAEALAAIPEADAAIVLLSYDPPAGQADLDLITRVRGVAKKLFFVLSKADRLDAAERDEARSYTQELLERQGIEAGKIWEVSPRGALRGEPAGELAEFSRTLRSFLTREREEILRRSMASKAVSILSEEEALCEMEGRSLQLGAEELESRIRRFDEFLAGARRERDEWLGILRQRFEAIFREYRQRASDAADPVRRRLRGELEALAADRRLPVRNLREQARRIVTERVDEWARACLPGAVEQAQRAFALFAGEARAWTEARVLKIWSSAGEMLGFEPPRVVPPEVGVRFHADTLDLASLRLALEGAEEAVSALLPRAVAARRVVGSARVEADDRILRAISQAEDAFYRPLERAFRDLCAGTLRAEDEIETAIHDVLARCRAERARGSEIRRSRIDGLQARSRSVSFLRAELERCASAIEQTA
jgi:Dynamin family